VELYPHSHNTPSWHGARLKKHRDNFIIIIGVVVAAVAVVVAVTVTFTSLEKAGHETVEGSVWCSSQALGHSSMAIALIFFSPFWFLSSLVYFNISVINRQIKPRVSASSPIQRPSHNLPLKPLSKPSLNSLLKLCKNRETQGSAVVAKDELHLRTRPYYCSKCGGWNPAP